MKDLLIFANKKCFWIHALIDWLNYGAISEISQCAGIFLPALNHPTLPHEHQWRDQSTLCNESNKIPFNDINRI